MGSPKFRSALNRRPIRVELDDGATFDFPGAVPARRVFEFMGRHGDVSDLASMTNEAFMELADIVAGKDGLEWLMDHCEFNEALKVLRWLLVQHEIVSDPDGEGDGNPPA